MTPQRPARRVHFIGIGGIGMSGIARLFLARGMGVSGSDEQEGPALRRLRELGAVVRVGHSAGGLNGAGLVVYSSSISPRNPELVAARNRGIPVLHRGQALAMAVEGRKAVAVAGAHGKSTTAALAGELLRAAGWDPTVVLGAELEALGGNIHAGSGGWAVVEADESDGSFLWLDPSVALLTNIDDEHLDYFRNSGEILAAYAGFADRVDGGGTLIGCADSEPVRRILAGSSRRRILYGLSEGADVTAEKVQLTAGGSRFLCTALGRRLGEVRLCVPGRHNVVNGLGVVALARVLGIDFRTAAAALERFRGTKRRFQIVWQTDGIVVVEDYAHHPTEIWATLEAARTWGPKRLLCVFQPHRYSRTLRLIDRFAGCFEPADELILLPIYAASEEPIDGVTSGVLLEKIRAAGKVRARLMEPEEALGALKREACSGDMVLFLGAGNVGALAHRFAAQLTGRTPLGVNQSNGSVERCA